MSTRFKIIPHIPNFITLLNLISGVIGVFLIFQDQVFWACYMMYFAAIFDFLDGFVARILKASSEIGKSLDSLADMISFGLLPTAIVFFIIKNILVKINPDFTLLNASVTETLLLATSLFIVAFSALRLANFNTDERQSYGFIGVPTPANALLISSFPFIIQANSWAGEMLMQLYVIIPLTLVLSFLLVSEIPMLSLKFKNFNFKDNKFKFMLLGFSLVSLIIFGISSVPVIFLFYILFSFLQARLKPIEEKH